MRYVLIIEIIGFFGVIGYLKVLQKRGLLTENRWSISITTYTSLLVGTVSLYSSTNPEGLFPPTSKGLLIAYALSLLWWIIEYPIARWVYHQIIQN